MTEKQESAVCASFCEAFQEALGGHNILTSKVSKDVSEEVSEGFSCINMGLMVCWCCLVFVEFTTYMLPSQKESTLYVTRFLDRSGRISDCCSLWWTLCLHLDTARRWFSNSLLSTDQLMTLELQKIEWQGFFTLIGHPTSYCIYEYDIPYSYKSIYYIQILAAYIYIHNFSRILQLPKLPRWWFSHTCFLQGTQHCISRELLGTSRPFEHGNLGGGFKYFLCSSLFGEMIQFD